MSGYGATSTTSTSASASPFGGSSLSGSSSPPTDPICLLFRSFSVTAPTTNSFGSVFAPGPSPASPNLFGSRSSSSSNLFGSASGAKPTSNPFGSSPSNPFGSSPSPPLFGTGALSGPSSSGYSNLIGSGAPTINLFDCSSAASASIISSHLFGPASSGSPPVSSSSSAVSTTFVMSVESCSSEGDCSSEDDLKHEAAFVAENQSPKVARQSSENSPEVLVKNELGHPAHGGISSVDVQLNSSLQNTLSPGKTHLIEQILRKHGDITKGSILRSTEAKTYFLQLVAEVVERLQSHTLGTISAHDIVTMQKWTNDAVAVGFNVEWLQQRIKKVTAISKYQDNSTRLTEISEKVEAARIALWEMELQEMIVKKEMEFMKADMDMESFCRSNLCEGLF